MPWFPEVPTSGFGYPRAVSKLALPREPLSAPNALELRPSELYSSRVIERRLPFPIPLLRFITKPFRASRRRYSGLIPPEKPFPLTQPNFLRRVGDLCSLGLNHLSGTPSEDPPREASPFTDLPSRSSVPKDLTISGTGSLKVSLSSVRHLPPKRAPACLMFWANCHPPPL